MNYQDAFQKANLELCFADLLHIVQKKIGTFLLEMLGMQMFNWF